MGFTKNALFPNTQKQFGEKNSFFRKPIQNMFFPILNHNKNNSQPIFLLSFYIKTIDFREFANPNKTVETHKKCMELKKNDDDSLWTDLKIQYQLLNANIWATPSS